MKQTIELFQSPVAEHLGWTLVHSVWQILLFAILYFVGYVFTQKPVFRYWLGMGILLSQVAVSGLTFWLVSSKATPSQANVIFVQGTAASSFQALIAYLKQNLSLLVGLWSIGALVLISRLGMGYAWVYRLKTNPHNTENALLADLVENLKNRMSITQTVAIKTTSLVQLPVIMGVVKPVILFPAAMLSGFSTAQLEAILAHELAHLKRHDFLWNGIQSVVEVVYFFHPVVWLISSEIRKERENCCDDFAVRYTGSQVLLAKTLVQLQELATAPSLVMAFGKKRFTLMERVQRIVGLQSNRSFTKESLWIIGGLVITFFAFAQTNSEKQATQKSLIPTERISPNFANDTTKKSSKNQSLRLMIHNDDEFIINDGKILFNGKEVEFSPENEALALKHLQEIRKKDLELEQQTQLIEQESLRISQLSQVFQQNERPIQEVSQKMQAVSQEMSVISGKYAHQLSSRRISEEEREQLAAKIEKEMQVQETKMKALEKEMERLTEDIDDNEPAMSEIEAKIEALEVPIEAISSEIEGHVGAIIELLPNDIRQKVKTKLPAPPPPPKPPKAIKAPKTPKAPLPPPAPPAPIKEN